MKLAIQRGTEEKKKFFGGTKTIYTLTVQFELSSEEERIICDNQLDFVFYEGMHKGKEFVVSTTNLRLGWTYKRELQVDIAEIESGITSNMEEFAGIVKTLKRQSKQGDSVIEFDT